MVEREINDNAIMVFRYQSFINSSKTYCGYCAEAKDLLNSLNVTYKSIEINSLQNSRDIQNYLKSKTGQYTVPQIFINRDHVGGCDDLIEEYENGNLKKRLAAININI